MKQIILATLIITLSFWGCTEQISKSVNAPISYLGHIDLILDLVTWYAIKNDSFIQNEFGVLNVDTAYLWRQAQL